MKKISLFLLALAISLPAIANEGMWLPILLNRNYEDMQKYGLQLSAEELYSVNNSSLKDAIVSFGGFCTGEVISSQGLVLTNHHCGFGAIQSHSSVENDYLTDGFWAMSLDEEKPTPDLFVRFLVRMEDVSAKVNASLNDDMSEDERTAAIKATAKTITDQAVAGSSYSADVKSFFHGNEFYLFVYETYTDIRLVGAPPSSVGKFGGDTDNWMWPRQTGDFSMFRIYSAPDGSPADYSEENIPLKPKHHLPVSLDGVKEGDFAMIFGYPGSTDRYLSSHGVKQAIDLYNPSVVEVRDIKLKVMKSFMDADDATRIAYASKYAQVANYWKYYIGQTEQLKNNHVYEDKKAIEDQFTAWVNKDPKRVAKYGTTIQMLEEAYTSTDAGIKSSVYVIEAGLRGADISLFGFRVGSYVSAMETTEDEMEEALKKAETDEEKAAIKAAAEEKLKRYTEALQALGDAHFKDYNAEVDQALLASTLEIYNMNISDDQKPEFFAKVNKKFKGDYDKFAAKVFESSLAGSQENFNKFMEDIDDDVLEDDWAVVMGNQFIKIYRGAESDASSADKKDKAYRLFTAGLREMNSDKNYAPDANSTMRVTYGTVGAYSPKDGVQYNYSTTAKGILQKEDPNDMEFIVPEQLISLIEKEDYGQYANEEGELPVCFISNNDITGGNSGSPVINGKGELIGCAFDGNWEAMSGDIFFEDQLQRTISVDIRYVLFIVDKYAGARNLINEMTLVKTEMPAETTENVDMPTKENMESAN